MAVLAPKMWSKSTPKKIVIRYLRWEAGLGEKISSIDHSSPYHLPEWFTFAYYRGSPPCAIFHNPDNKEILHSNVLGDGLSYSRFSGNLCAFCGWRVTFVRVRCGAVVHETIHVFKRDLGRGTQHLGEGSWIFEYLYISFLSSSCCTFEDPPGPLG